MKYKCINCSSILNIEKDSKNKYIIVPTCRLCMSRYARELVKFYHCGADNEDIVRYREFGCAIIEQAIKDYKGSIKSGNFSDASLFLYDKEGDYHEARKVVCSVADIDISTLDNKLQIQKMKIEKDAARKSRIRERE